MIPNVFVLFLVSFTFAGSLAHTNSPRYHQTQARTRLSRSIDVLFQVTMAKIEAWIAVASSSGVLLALLIRFVAKVNAAFLGSRSCVLVVQQR